MISKWHWNDLKISAKSHFSKKIKMILKRNLNFRAKNQHFSLQLQHKNNFWREKKNEFCAKNLRLNVKDGWCQFWRENSNSYNFEYRMNVILAWKFNWDIFCDFWTEVLWRDTFFTKVVKGHKTIFMNFRLDSRGKDHSWH